MTNSLAPKMTADLAPAPVSTGNPIFDLIMNEQMFAQLQRGSKLFAESGLVPDHFRNNVGGCFVALQLASQLGVNPFMLMQRMYVVKGKIGIEAQVAIAVANQRGIFTGPIEYEFAGSIEKKDRSCTAKATLSATKKEVSLTIDWRTVEAEGWMTKDGSKWRTMPDQMFRYRTAAWLIRTYAPEVLMGLNTADELEDAKTIDITPKKPAAGDPFAEALRTGNVTDAEPGSTEPGKSPATAPDSGQGDVENAKSDTNTPERADGAKSASLDEIPTLFEQAGLDGQGKATFRRNIVKTATDGRTEVLEECSDDELTLVASTLRRLIERKAKREAGEQK